MPPPRTAAHEKFGSADDPLRMSNLNNLLKCCGFAVLSSEADRSSNQAADNGTALGLAVELYHAGTDDFDAVMQQVRDAAEKGWEGRDPFSLANLETVASWFRKYYDDPRNPVDAVILDSLELEVKIDVAPHATDPTQQPIRLVGHIDQIRRAADGVLEVWDVKTGVAEGEEMVAEFGWQQGAYALGAAIHYGEPVRWGGIIRIRGYDTRRRDPVTKKLVTRTPGTEPVFFPSYWSQHDCEAAMKQVALHVANIRRGDVPLTPGKHCDWCPASSFRVCRMEFDV